MAIKNIIAKDQRDAIAADEIAPNVEGVREPARLVLHREAETDPEPAAIAKQLLE